MLQSNLHDAAHIIRNRWHASWIAQSHRYGHLQANLLKAAIFQARESMAEVVMTVFRNSLRCGAVMSVALVLGVLMSQATAQDFNRGQALYENHCQFCHASWAHSREGHVVANYADLRKRVRSWSDHSGLAWSEEDIDAVTRYLNQRFYQLPTP